MTYVRLRLALLGSMLGSAMALVGCTNLEKMPRPEAGTRPMACTMEHVPVCASKGRDHRTFSNACMAKAEGYTVDRAGACG
jgi:hypothetical protein